MILLIEGSPRREGNGAYLADKIAGKYAGDEVMRLRLYDMNFKGCSSCRKCRENNSYCVLEDDIAPLYPKLAEANKIILIAPCFYGHVNGETKMFTDRLYCMKNADRTSKYKEGAKMVFLVTLGSARRDRADSVLAWMKNIADNATLKYYGLAVPNCSFDTLNGVKQKEDEIMMSISFFA